MIQYKYQAIVILIFVVLLTNAQQTPEEIVAQLSLCQKIGQLFVVAAASDFNQPTEQLASSFAACPYAMDPEYIEHLIRDYFVGGVIFLYKSDPATQISYTKKFQAIAPIPLLIVQDSEWGLSMRLDKDPTKVVRYPHHMTLGAIQDEQIIYDVAYEIGKQCAAIGVHVNLAPVADVNNNRANLVIHDRSFGDNPQRVARCAQLYAQGLHDAGVLACAKHFPGHGDTNIDSHFDLPSINYSRARLDAVELVPFYAVIEDNIDAIMHAHFHIPVLDAENPSSLSHAIVTQLLQQELGYKGLNITDGLGMKAVSKRYKPGELELAAFLAGNDILLCPLDVTHAAVLIEHAIKDGIVSEDNLNQRVIKIIRAKMCAFEKQSFLSKAVVDVEAFLTRAEAYALQWRAYRAAITLVQQNNRSISLSKDIFNKSFIMQIGQLPGNAFIEACMKRGKKVADYSAALTNEELSAAIAATQQHNIIVLAFCQMNKFVQQNFGIAENSRKLIARLRENGKKVIVALFGTPYAIALLQEADMIITAYEDVSVVQEAVVDVLCGNFVPTGILPVKI